MMYTNITLKRGLDLKIKGAVESGTPVRTIRPERVAVVPDDFPGFTPRVAVKAGEQVKAGDALMTDKISPAITLVSPVSGTVEEVVRGDRRKVLRIVVKCDEGAPATADTGKPESRDAAAMREMLMKNGLWALMRQLPYGIVPDAEATPRDIFVTAFDSAPLATPLTERLTCGSDCIKAGLEALAALTPGKVYLSMREADTETLGATADNIKNVETVVVKGPHPAGLPSIQAANIKPVNKGETVWLLDITTVGRIGSVVLNGTCDWDTTIALTGSEVKEPCLIKTTTGAVIASLTEGNLDSDGAHKRIISGSVLCGVKTGADGFLHYPYRQITVIPEGDDVDEFMGWASLSPSKMSQSRSFLSWLMPGRRYAPDARLNGGRRAMIMSGLYESMLPMDIMAEHLIKATMARDIDKMEALGIYEVTPEDFALCEYVDPSKLELQKIMREGLDYLRKELS